jgi:ribosomal protein S18 acetylase RimI-like enzyme
MGLASGLLQHVIICHKIDKIFVEVASFNTTAINFYVKSGFVQVGIRPSYLEDSFRTPQSAILMCKELATYTEEI